MVSAQAFLIEGPRELPDQAVQRGLVADVPAGLFVSGGLDSGLAAALVSKTRGQL